MKTIRFSFPLTLFAGVFALGTVCVCGVILHETGDPEANTSEPTGELAGSGWQYQGSWNGFLGTPIASQFFITAAHVFGNVGDKFRLQERDYVTTAFFDDPNSDLRLWRVCGTFPVFAPLYRSTDEVGKPLVVFGHGTQRGEPVFANEQLRGWRWGALDGRLRWGQNQVAGLSASGEAAPGSPPNVRRNLLRATFDADGGTNEAHLSLGDSGGGVFIRDAEGWQLAGIAFAADGVYNTVPEGDGFAAALFNATGLYEKNGDQWRLISSSGIFSSSTPGAFYASRISSSLSWIESVLSSAANETAGLILQSASQPDGPYADETEVMQAGNNTLVVPRSSDTTYYRLRNCQATRIQSIAIEGDNALIRFSVE